MTLFAAWSEIVADWNASFPQQRTFRRAARQALGALVCVGRRCLTRIHSTFHLTVDRESLVSSLTKKVARGDRFLRTGKNTFALRPEAR